MATAPYKAPAVENDQHEPHIPWFLIEVTTPFPLQSIEVGADLRFDELSIVVP